MVVGDGLGDRLGIVVDGVMERVGLGKQLGELGVWTRGLVVDWHGLWKAGVVGARHDGPGVGWDCVPRGAVEAWRDGPGWELVWL